MHRPDLVNLLVTAGRVGCLMIDHAVDGDLIHLSLELRADTAGQHQEADARALACGTPAPVVYDDAGVDVEIDDCQLSYNLRLNRPELDQLVAYLTAAKQQWAGAA